MERHNIRKLEEFNQSPKLKSFSSGIRGRQKMDKKSSVVDREEIKRQQKITPKSEKNCENNKKKRG